MLCPVGWKMGIHFSTPFVDVFWISVYTKIWFMNFFPLLPQKLKQKSKQEDLYLDKAKQKMLKKPHSVNCLTEAFACWQTEDKVFVSLLFTSSFSASKFINLWMVLSTFKLNSEDNFSSLPQLHPSQPTLVRGSWCLFKEGVEQWLFP